MKIIVIQNFVYKSGLSFQSNIKDFAVFAKVSIERDQKKICRSSLLGSRSCLQ